MNFLQIVNRVRQDSGITGADLITVAGQSGESLRIINWVNEAWLDLQAMRTDWLWLRKSVAFPTVYGQGSYTTAQIGLTDFGSWDIETFRNYQNPQVSLSIASPCVASLPANRLVAGDTVTFFTNGSLPAGLTAGMTYFVVNPSTDSFQISATSGGAAIATSGTQIGTHTLTSSNTTAFVGLTSEVFMSDTSYDQWRDAYQYGALRMTHTRPIEIAITPSMGLALGPVPADGYTVVGEYFSAPTEMSANTDTPALPSKFHLAIVYKAMIAYGMYEAASEVVGRGQVGEAKWLRRIHFEQMAQTEPASALA